MSATESEVTLRFARNDNRSYVLGFDYELNRGREIRGQRRFKMFPFAGARMMEAKLPRMQHLVRKIFRKPWRIDFVAENGVTEMMKMHANLMSASAVKPAFDQTCLITRADDAIFGLGRSSTGRSRTHSLTMDRMSSDFFFNYATWFA